MVHVVGMGMGDSQVDCEWGSWVVALALALDTVDIPFDAAALAVEACVEDAFAAGKSPSPPGGEVAVASCMTADQVWEELGSVRASAVVADVVSSACDARDTAMSKDEPVNSAVAALDAVVDSERRIARTPSFQRCQKLGNRSRCFALFFDLLDVC